MQNDMELHWTASFSASCLHAADAMRRGRALADSALSTAIGDAAAELQRQILAAGLPVERFWRHLTALAGSIENNRRLAETALIKTIGRSPRAAVDAPRLESSVAELEAAARPILPRVAEQLPAQSRSLRAQWEEQGAALMNRMASLTDARILAPRAEIVLVHPALGGSGRAHLPYNTVRIEALPTPDAGQLPETLRLAWLLGQLNLDLPVLSDAIHRDRLPEVAEAAMLPAALQASELFQQVHCDEAAVARALEAWDLATPLSPNAAETIVTWWETHLDSDARWDVSLAALDRMLG